MEVGLRVVRGPDWKWGNQDGGEGHVGTVVEIGKVGSATSPDKTVVVQWDSGSRTNYRIGYQNAYDLRIFDNAPIGVKHPNIICNACKKHGLAGIRWKCTKCYDFDLCTQCYMADKHDLSHPFLRFENTTSVGKELPKRQGAVKIQAKGIFVGAKVVRGPDWDWGCQDGGDGKTGRVIDIRGWDNESSRSVANVTWTSGSTNVYRLGHKGKVDLKYVQEASGGFYYRDHLPVLGEEVERLVAHSAPSRQSILFSVGDRVKVILDVETLKKRQEGHGGWNPRMAEFIGKVGYVHRVTERGDIRVQYDGCNNRWTFHPSALTKVTSFAVGDVVRIIGDLQKVKELQKGHGEWIDVMKWTLDKTGKVLKVYSDGDLRVKVNGQSWTLNPLCVIPAPGSATELNNTMTANEREEHANPMAPLLPKFLDQQLDPSGIDHLVREAAQGHTEVVRELIQKCPERVDHKSSGKTALQVACHQGHMEIVKMVLGAGANLEVQDDDGDTALHYSAFGNQSEVMEYLLKKGANIDATNKGRCSTLHVAVNKQHVHCVKVLLRHGCNVNIQDSYGDTALHDAIGKESCEIIDLLVNVVSIDFGLRNKRGFNVLHHAALKGNNFATERLLFKSRQIVDVKKDDGFAALHLAALNGHRLVAETLLTQGQCEIDIQNNRKQTPLLLAISQGHCALIELLVTMGSNLNAEDEDGDTGLHLALMRQRTGFADVNEMEAPTIHMILEDLHAKGLERNVGLAVACYLAQENGNLHHKNRQGKTPLDLLTEAAHSDVVQEYAAQKSYPWSISSTVIQTDNQQDGAVVEQAGMETQQTQNECLICCEAVANVIFEPCGHEVACEDCCARMKKCIECQAVIVKKTGSGGMMISPKIRQVSVERVKYLESKIQEIEEASSCSICMERRKNVAFLCGHGACVNCSQTLKICHMCRKPITKKINLY